MRPRSPLFAACWSLLCIASGAHAQPTADTSGPTRSFGAVMSPAALPAGSTTAYAVVGAPEVSGGYRQGLSFGELEARAALNYLALGLIAEGLVRVPVLTGPVAIAPELGLGLHYSSGARYFDAVTFQYVGLRPRVGVIASMELTETLQAVGEVDLPWTFTLNPGDGWHVTPRGGGGVELFLGQGMTGLVVGRLGLDALKEPQGVAQYRLGYEVKLGLGFRVF